jgi:hypothetical protein
MGTGPTYPCSDLVSGNQSGILNQLQNTLQQTFCKANSLGLYGIAVRLIHLQELDHSQQGMGGWLQINKEHHLIQIQRTRQSLGRLQKRKTLTSLETK